MFLPSDQPVFGITHPLGLPRPLDPENFFGAKAQFFAFNQMPIPGGCLAHFDGAVYRPYLNDLLSHLAAQEPGWDGLARLDQPPRYCLLRDGVPSSIPLPFRSTMPTPPQVRLEGVLTHLGRHHGEESSFELLDLLTLISEDLGPYRFAAATAKHAWVADFMR